MDVAKDFIVYEHSSASFNEFKKLQHYCQYIICILDYWGSRRYFEILIAFSTSGFPDRLRIH